MVSCVFATKTAPTVILKVWGAAWSRNNIPEGVILNYRDVTERVKAEENLHLSEQRWGTILEDIHEGYLRVDLAGSTFSTIP